MTHIVLDLEWNQPYAPKYMIRKPIKLTGEIVQIGAAKLNEEFEVVDTFKIMVQPQFYTRMHSKVAKLTHIYTDDLQYGFPFRQALTHFKKWCGSDFVFITWGWDDIGMLQDNMAIHELDTSWLPQAFNLQPMYNNQISKEDRQASLREAMERLNLDAAEAHDALNDARNTAQICRCLDMALGFEMYDSFKKPRKKDDGEVATANTRKSYGKRIDAMRAPELNAFVCNECGETVYCGEWVRQNGDKFATIAKCSCGDEFFIRLRFRKNNDGTFRAGIVVYKMTDEFRTQYEELLVRQAIKEEKARQFHAIEALAV
ncbi:MAG: exonuclease domain-containing protein [Ruminococcaceae bacterium]|nr:exonuclease domain-containing protein [Oscillospiraceae bacterium]